MLDQTPPGQYLKPFQRKQLQKKLESDLPKQYRQRIQIMLLADEGKTLKQICTTVGCSRRMVQDWILKARAGLAHQWNHNPIGRPKAVNEQYRERLKELVTKSPKEFGYSFTSWTAQYLSKHLARDLGIKVSSRHINRLLKDMGLSTRSKPANFEMATNQTNTKPGLVIRDLTEVSVIEFPELWLLSSIN